jgi:hypothetical protein
MDRKLVLVFPLFTISVSAELALFDELHRRQAIVLVLPDGSYDAKVIARARDRLTASLAKTTSVRRPQRIGQSTARRCAGRRRQADRTSSGRRRNPHRSGSNGGSSQLPARVYRSRRRDRGRNSLRS